jgi:hypothetical protein
MALEIDTFARVPHSSMDDAALRATGASGYHQKQSDQVQKSITEAENLP